VNEDEPLEKEVALDPELLGKIYEKLNAIRDDNFDEYLTALKSGKAGEETKFNKEYGVYYTPREIVHYICQESLINYLYTNLNGKVPKDDIDFLVKNVEISEEYEAIALEKEKKINNGYQKGSEYESKLPESIKIYAKDIDILLSDITVCDPAIGSGAFPIGMLHEIIRLRKLLAVFHNSNMDFYDIKRQCIEKTLYGVDIDAGAIETCKLRFWLSLIVDEDDFSNIRPLPNLDYKIVCGNSLIGINVDLFNNDDLILLSKYEKEFFNETNPINKLGLKKLINDLINRITDGKSVFDFKIYFQEVFLNKGGFDVVIGNPPYIGEKGHKEIFEKVKNGNLCDFYVGKMDYFYFFFHLALNIVRDNGIIAFITTNYYITALGGKKLREDLYNRATIKKLVNFNELKIFESATGQHNMITILQKGKNKNELANTCITHRKGHATSEILQKILSGDDDETDYYQITQENLYDGNEYYIRLIPNDKEPIQKILDKIKNKGIKLGEICNVNTGIMGGCDYISKRNIDYCSSQDRIKNDIQLGDGVFVLDDTNERDREIIKDIIKTGYLYKFYKNSDIERFYTNNSTSKYIIFSSKDNGAYNNNDIKRHLDKFKSILEKNREINNEDIDLYPFLRRGTAHQYIFESPKIVAPQRSPRNTFGYNEIPWYAASDVFFITQKDENVSLKYILALLNSKLYYLWLYYR
ncbi:MAG: Eco57I restriction-modification methylase domain-containing protein, partial [Bacteroidales bacterium]